MATAPTPLPALSRTDPAFKSKVNALFLSQLPAWTVACNAQALEIYGIAETVNGYKNAAAASAGTAATQVGLAAAQVGLATAEKNLAAGYAAQAAAYANAPRWTPGAYAVDAVRASTLNRFAYRCYVAVASPGTTDPAADPTHWEPIGYTVAVALGASNNLDCSVSNSFTKTVSSNIAFTISNIPPAPARCEVVVEVNHTGGNFTLPAGSYWGEGIQPNFNVGKVHLLYMTTRDGGITKRWVASPNFAA